MENEEKQYLTETHSEELDNMFNESSFSLDEENYENRDLVKDSKTLFRFLRKKLKSVIREKSQRNFTNIIYLTLDCPPFTKNSTRQDSPLEFVTELRKQYPYNDIRVLIPVIGLKEENKPSKKLTVEIENKECVLEKTSLHFNFFLQNKTQEAIVYKFPQNSYNIDVYGIYSPAFSKLNSIQELSKLQYLAPFIKTVRLAVKNFKKLGFYPEIIHSEHIPYYLGGEFEFQIPGGPKVLQIVKDFTQIEMAKPEVFWAAINLADELSMSKICRDSVIKKCLARLFNLKETKRFTRMRDCLEFIYENYTTFRKYVEQGEVLDENIIFRKLNKRINELFPNISDNEPYYNQIVYTIKKADYWAVSSKTYYKEIFDFPKISGKIYPLLEKTKDKSSYISYGYNTELLQREEGRGVYQNFSSKNFREQRSKNKSILLKEFSTDRIKTNFIDSNLFVGETPAIIGNLDSFYEAPLLFTNTTSEIFANGIDILFNSILKLFELHKNIQIIICINNGLKNNFIKSWVDFLSENKYLNGRWVFIDGELNVSRFFAAADMILLPRRINMTNPEHYIAMYYGCVPIVARSGILNDTVIDIFDDITLGCGFKTKKSLLTEDDNPEIFLTPLMKALQIYQNNPASWNLLIKNCMNYDSRWSFKTLEKYNNIYQNLL